jgi:hypothetical protein
VKPEPARHILKNRIIITLDNVGDHSYKVTGMKRFKIYQQVSRLGEVPRATQFRLMIKKLSKALMRA